MRYLKAKFVGGFLGPIIGKALIIMELLPSGVTFNLIFVLFSICVGVVVGIAVQDFATMFRKKV